MIDIINLGIKYTHKYYSLFGFSLTVNEGDHILLQGDEDSGNMQVTRCLSKMDREYEGQICIDCVDIKRINYKHSEVGYFIDTPTLFMHKTVLANLIYPLIIRKTKKPQAQTIAYDILKEFSMQQLADIKCKNLSVDDQKIIAALRLYIRKPKIIIAEVKAGENKEKYAKLLQILNKVINASNCSVVACPDSAPAHNTIIRMEYGTKKS